MLRRLSPGTVGCRSCAPLGRLRSWARVSLMQGQTGRRLSSTFCSRRRAPWTRTPCCWRTAVRGSARSSLQPCVLLLTSPACVMLMAWVSATSQVCAPPGVRRAGGVASGRRNRRAQSRRTAAVGGTRAVLLRGLLRAWARVSATARAPVAVLLEVTTGPARVVVSRLVRCAPLCAHLHHRRSSGPSVWAALGAGARAIVFREPLWVSADALASAAWRLRTCAS